MNETDELESIFWELWQEAEPKTPDFQENKQVRHILLDRVKETVERDWVDKWDNIHLDYTELQCRRFFHHGLRFGLRLLLFLHEAK